MLTIYQQIQATIDVVEADLAKTVTAAEAADVACMSVRNLHRYFPALTGYRFGEYARRRRLTVGADELRTSERTIIRIAIDCGYDSHEAFTRAFTQEHGVTPSEFRGRGILGRRTPRIDLVGEVNMGVLTKHLKPMEAVVFDGYAPNPEDRAVSAMDTWLESHPDITSYRVFGHNIDEHGLPASDPDNVGYRIYVTVDPDVPISDAARTTIEAGAFLVTGIEGSFEEDPGGAWVGAGWDRMNEMARRSGMTISKDARWFEEVLEPTEPGNTRFDLLLEIAES